MLRPLEGEGSSASTPQKGANKPDPARQTVTFRFDFDQKPSVSHIKTFGHALNKLFEQNTLGVNGIRWGGMQPTATGTAIRFINRLRRASLLRQMKEQLTIDTDRLDQWLPGNSLAPPTPSSLGQLSPGDVAICWDYKWKPTNNISTFKPTIHSFIHPSIPLPLHPKPQNPSTQNPSSPPQSQSPKYLLPYNPPMIPHPLNHHLQNPIIPFLTKSFICKNPKYPKKK